MSRLFRGSLALLVAAVAGLLAVGNTALAHDATVPRSTEVSDCDEAITTLSRSQYLVCDDLESFFADETNKSRYMRHLIDCPTTPAYPTVEKLRGKEIDRLWGNAKDWTLNKCRPWANRLRNKLKEPLNNRDRGHERVLRLRFATLRTNGDRGQGEGIGSSSWMSRLFRGSLKTPKANGARGVKMKCARRKVLLMGARLKGKGSYSLSPA